MKNSIRRRAIQCIVVSATLVGQIPAITQDSSGTSIDWSERARDDIRSAHEHMLENHPGPVDEAQPEFLALAARALAGSLELAEQAESALEWRYAVMSYAAQFRDGHFAIRAQDHEESPKPRWPGFTVAWRDNRVLIHHSEDHDNFPVGAELVSCDGKAVRACIEEHLFRFAGDPAIEGSWTLETPG